MSKFCSKTIKLITIISLIGLISADWEGSCPRVKYPPLANGWQGALGLWYRSAQSGNPMLPGDPKIGCSYTRFENTCEQERPWFIMKDHWDNYNSTGGGSRYGKVEPYTWNDQPTFWFVDLWDHGTYHYEMLDIAEDEFMFVFICQGYRGERHDEDAVLFTREAKLTDSQKAYLMDKMKKAMEKSGVNHVDMKWLDETC